MLLIVVSRQHISPDIIGPSASARPSLAKYFAKLFKSSEARGAFEIAEASEPGLFEMEMVFLFFALFVLEIILEIDNITALKQAASNLPATLFCRGHMPQALALLVRVFLAYALFHVVAFAAALPSAHGRGFFEFYGGALIILMACGLLINHSRKTKSQAKEITKRRSRSVASTSLLGFLFADAFLSLDTVVAAVAMTSNFSLAITAMVGAAISIMLFHKPLQLWLKQNPRMAPLAFCVIGLMGVNLILSSQGVHIPKYALLAFAFLCLTLDFSDRSNKARASVIRERFVQASGGASQVRGLQSHLVETIGKIPDYVAPASDRTVRTTKREAPLKTIDSTWAEVVQKSEELRSIVYTQQAAAGGVYDYAPDGSKIESLIPSAFSGMVDPAATVPVLLDGYAFGTTHRADTIGGRSALLFANANNNPTCRACGIEQPRIFSVCSGCGYYRFLCPAGIFEVGSLRLLKART